MLQQQPVQARLQHDAILAALLKEESKNNSEPHDETERDGSETSNYNTLMREPEA